jgi:hypothetical protein
MIPRFLYSLSRKKLWKFRVKEAENDKRRFVVQLLSCIGIDVIHHKVDIFLVVGIKALSLGHNPSD